MGEENLSPYQQVALSALQEFHGMSYEEALAEAKECTTPEKIAEMEKKIDAKYSMDSAIDGLCFELEYKNMQLERCIKLAEEGKDAIEEKKKSALAFMYKKQIKAMEQEVEDYYKTAANYGDVDKDLPIYKEMFKLFEGEDKTLSDYVSEAIYGGEDISKFEELLKELNLNKNELVIDILEHVHSKWIEKADADKEGRFFDPTREKRRFQFSRGLLIGFEEFKKDLLFAKPILDKLGIEYTEEGIKALYESKVREFMEGIESKEDLQKYIIDSAKRQLVYKGLEENKKRRLEAQTDPEVAMQIVEQILEHNPIVRDIIKEKENENEVKSMKKTSLWDKVRAFFVKENAKAEPTNDNAEKLEPKKNNFRDDIKQEPSGNEPKSEEPRGNERVDYKAPDGNSENNNDKTPEDEGRID